MCAHCYPCPRRPLPGPTSTAITLPSRGGGGEARLFHSCLLAGHSLQRTEQSSKLESTVPPVPPRMEIPTQLSRCHPLSA